MSGLAEAEGLQASRNLRQSADEFFNKAHEHISHTRKHKRRLAHQCTYCGKKSGANLQACSLCKSARYCNRNCQLADYKTRHKKECAEFIYPPLTRAFLTEPLENEKYPERPVFAHGFLQDVGCWVSIDGQVNCGLAPPSEAMQPESDTDALTTRHKELADRPELGRKYNAFARSLLSLSVLVQNRKKDKMCILVYGSRMQLVSYGETTNELLKGKGENDKISTFPQQGHSLAAVGVAEDIITGDPRLCIKNVNGVEITSKTPLPKNVHDAKKGIVSLMPGEYVIFTAQFRVGDGDAITKDWEALRCLQGFSLAWSIWQQTIDPLMFDNVLAQHLGKDGRVPQGLRLMFDHPCIGEYYADFIERGEDAFIRSHHGEERANIVNSGYKMMEVMGKEILGVLEQDGQLDSMYDQMRQMGLGDMIETMEASRRAGRGTDA